MTNFINRDLSVLKELRNEVDTNEIIDKIKVKRFIIRDLQISNRVIIHWEKSGILDKNHEALKWKKYNLIEYVWIKIIQKMREFNIPLNTIKNVKEILFHKIDLSKQLKNENVIRTIKEINEDKNINEITEGLKRKEVKEEMANNPVLLLEMIVLDIILLKNYYSLLVNSNGDLIPIKYSAISHFQDNDFFNQFIRKSYISVSITEILTEFIVNKTTDLVYNKLALITSEELAILEILKEKGIKSVEITFDNKDKIDLIKISKEQKIDKRSRLIEIIMNNGYQDIKVKTQKGQIISCINTRKLKYDNIMNSTE